MKTPLCFSGRSVDRLIFCLGLVLLLSPALLPSRAFAEQTITRGAPEANKEATQPPEGQKIAPEAFFALMLMNAEKGQGKAMLNLGLLYEQGIGVPRNFSKALEWYRKAGDAGEGEGHMRVGRCYEIGMGAAVDMHKAVEGFEKAHALGYVPAMSRLADVYLNGRGAARDENKGFDLLTRAAEAGDAAALFDLGRIALNGLYSRKTEAEKARAWFLKAAEAGHAGGILAVAGMCREGQGGKADAEGALRWYLTAQKGGLQAEGLESAIAELKKTLSANQAKAAEQAADAWLAARAETLKQPTPAR
jgi:TPR repeat protein